MTDDSLGSRRAIQGDWVGWQTNHAHWTAHAEQTDGVERPKFALRIELITSETPW